MILVFGASRGIGFEIASSLSKRGKSVIGFSRSNVANCGFKLEHLDVCDDAMVAHSAKAIKSSKIPVEAVINVAGIASMNLALMTPRSVTEKLIATNFLGTVSTCKHFAPLLIRNGGGLIINFSTIAVQLSLEGESSYVASKAAVESYSRVLARELAPHNVRVNCIAPGPIATELLQGVSDVQIQRILDRQVIRRLFNLRDVADLVEVLLDDRARSLTGQVFHLGGV